MPKQANGHPQENHEASDISKCCQVSLPSQDGLASSALTLPQMPENGNGHGHLQTRKERTSILHTQSDTDRFQEDRLTWLSEKSPDEIDVYKSIKIDVSIHSGRDAQTKISAAPHWPQSSQNRLLVSVLILQVRALEQPKGKFTNPHNRIHANYNI